jgi:hypothetical protein
MPAQQSFDFARYATMKFVAFDSALIENEVIDSVDAECVSLTHFLNARRSSIALPQRIGYRNTMRTIVSAR